MRGRTSAADEIVDSGRTLYATLTPEQRAVADRRLSLVVTLLATGVTPAGMMDAPAAARGARRRRTFSISRGKPHELPCVVGPLDIAARDLGISQRDAHVLQQMAAASLGFAVVPEPASLALVGLGLLGLAASRRSKAKAYGTWGIARTDSTPRPLNWLNASRRVFAPRSPTRAARRRWCP